MAFDLVNFLDQLATFIAAAAALNYADMEAPRSLWRNRFIEDESLFPVSVLRAYGGSVPYVPLPKVLIQAETLGAAGNDDPAFEQAWKIAGALCDADGRPLRMTAISDDYRINGILNLGVPGQLGRDDNQRAKVVFNFECEVCKLTA